MPSRLQVPDLDLLMAGADYRFHQHLYTQSLCFARDIHGLTALMLAFKWRRNKYLDLAALLLAAGADGMIVRLPRKSQSLSQFFHICVSPSAGNAQDACGRTALYYAALNKDAKAVEILARQKVQGALEVAAALDLDGVLREALGTTTVAAVNAR